jgi:lipoprotein-anchoring transpeptidase ErfK/SrfK
MRRILVSALGASAAVTCAASALAPLRAHAGPVDGDWQLAYGEDAAFTDETGQRVIGRAYQPAVTYYAPPQADPSTPPYYQPPPQPRVHQQTPAPQGRLRQPAPAYYQQSVAPHARTQQPGQVYYLPSPAPQARMQPPAQAYYQQQPAPQARMQQPAPAYYQQQPAPQPRPQQAAQTAYYQQQAPAQPAAVQSAPASSYQAPPPQSSGSGQQIYASAQPHEVRGFWSALTGDRTGSVQGASQPAVSYPQQAQPRPQQQAFGYPAPAYAPSSNGDMSRPTADPRYDRQLVDYRGDAAPGTIIVDSPHFFLYLVLQGGHAIRYGIGVGRPGFTWAGVKEISAMREWPDWRPPVAMIERRPDLPRFMPGGPDNPLGARALYLGSSLYRIHGSNEPWTIGTQVSSGCIRMRNDDVVDLYSRVKVGTKVVVI